MPPKKIKRQSESWREDKTSAPERWDGGGACRREPGTRITRTITRAIRCGPLAFSLMALGVGVSLGMARKKSALERKLAESIRAVKRGEIPKRDSLGNRLREMDDLNIPDALADIEDDDA